MPDTRTAAPHTYTPSNDSRLMLQEPKDDILSLEHLQPLQTRFFVLTFTYKGSRSSDARHFQTTRSGSGTTTWRKVWVSDIVIRKERRRDGLTNWECYHILPAPPYDSLRGDSLCPKATNQPASPSEDIIFGVRLSPTPRIEKRGPSLDPLTTNRSLGCLIGSKNTENGCWGFNVAKVFLGASLGSKGWFFHYFYWGCVPALCVRLVCTPVCPPQARSLGDVRLTRVCILCSKNNNTWWPR